MRRIGLLEGAAAVALLAIVVACWTWRYRIASVDLSLHYALVEYIRELWTWPTLDVTRMGEMNAYPPVAHTVAAILANLFGSTFIALYLTSVFSAVLALAMLLLLMRFHSGRATVVATWTFVVWALVMQRTHSFFGHEIVGNFFFAQMFGEMCVIALMLIRSRISLGVIGDTVFAFAGVAALGWVYPMAAVQFAGAMVVLRALGLYEAWLVRQLSVRDAVGAVALVALLIGAIVLHPRFAFGVTLAAHEGGSGIRIKHVLIVPIVLALLAATFVLFLASARRRLTLIAPEAFTALCGGVALTALAQTTAYYLGGLGSSYIVSKHFFPVLALLGASLIVLIANVWVRSGHEWARSDSESATHIFLGRLAFAPAALVALGISNPPWKGYWTEPVVATERFLRSSLQAMPQARGHSILLEGGLITHFTFSMGLLHLPKEKALAIIDEANSTPEQRKAVVAATPVTYAFIATERVRDPGCSVRSDAPAKLSMVMYACVMK